jgi:hypothetical protein
MCDTCIILYYRVLYIIDSSPERKARHEPEINKESPIIPIHIQS